MKSIIKSVLPVLSAAAATIAGMAAPAAAEDNAKATVVLVHGAFADGSSWDKVIPLLQAEGLQVVSVQNPLTSLADDVAATRRTLDRQSGPVVLVGHSWAGMVISEAGTQERVKSLVYVAAFAPSEGQSVADLGKGFTTAPGSKFLVADQAGFLTLSPEGVAKHFAQDLPAAETDLITTTQGPISARSFDEKATAAAWRIKPSWFIVAQQDHMIDPALENAMAGKISARIVSLPTSHVPMLSQPARVAEVIVEAARATAVTVTATATARETK